MLVEPAHRDDKFLGIPGGYVEPGETPYETAVRKVEDELGVSFPVGRLLVVDWAPAADDEKIVFVFEGPRLGPEDLDRIKLDPASLRGVSFHEPQDTTELLMTRLVKRIEVATPARAARTTAYLEHGEPVDGAHG